MHEIYKKLRQRFDDISTGFPETPSGTEYKILQNLFTVEEAGTFLALSQMLETPAQIAPKLGKSEGETADHLEDMAKRGLVFRVRKGDEVKYAAVPFIVGIFEFQLKRLKPEFVHDYNTYFEEGFGKDLQGHGTPIMRTVPIDTDLAVSWPVAPFDDAIGMIDEQEYIALADCICRTAMTMIDKGCDKPRETCLLFGSHGKYYVENGMARVITRDEAKEVIRRNEKAGLVIQPFNSIKAGGMCSCCGCCCGIMRSLKLQPEPAKAVQSNYFAAVDVDQCNGCKVCVKRCQMGAVTVTDKKASIDLKRCIGCGLCVTTCKPKAMKLVRKKEDELYTPPQAGLHTYIQILQRRGKI